MPVKQLDDGSKYIKATYYSGEALKGNWEIFIKLDGVRALRMADGSVVSRNSKPLYNLDYLEFTDAEIFSKDWNTSVSLVRTESYKEITQEMVYQLDPPDPRLHLISLTDPLEATLTELMEEMLALGHEGLIIRKGKKWLKVVPELQADVEVIGFKEGTGRNKGRLGSIETRHGSVGSGFSDEQRNDFWHNKTNLIGKIIQVGYREMTAAKKLRFPKFQFVRFDKNEESLA